MGSKVPQPPPPGDHQARPIISPPPPVSVCQGKKVVKKTEGLLYSTSQITIDEAVIAREVDKESGVIAINGYRFPKHENFPGEIKLALTKEAAKSLVDQLSKLLS